MACSFASIRFDRFHTGGGAEESWSMKSIGFGVQGRVIGFGGTGKAVFFGLIRDHQAGMSLGPG